MSSDGDRVKPVDHLIMHHSVGPIMDNWRDSDVSNWFNSVGRTRGYAGVAHSFHHDPYSNVETFSQAHYCLHPYTVDGNKYGWRLTLLMKDPFENVAWHAGNWPINQRSIGIETAGRYDEPNPKLDRKALMLVADTFRDWDKSLGGILQIFGHKQVSGAATACPGQIVGQLDELIDMFNDPEKYYREFGWIQDPPVDNWKAETKDIGVKEYQFKQDGALYEINTSVVKKNFAKGEKLSLRYQYKDWLISDYSYSKDIKNGFKMTELELVNPPVYKVTVTLEKEQEILSTTEFDRANFEYNAQCMDNDRRGTGAKIKLYKDGNIEQEHNSTFKEKTFMLLYNSKLYEDNKDLKESEARRKYGILKGTLIDIKGGMLQLVDVTIPDQAVAVEGYAKDVWAIYEKDGKLIKSCTTVMEVSDYVKEFRTNALYEDFIKIAQNSLTEEIIKKENVWEIWLNSSVYAAYEGDLGKVEADKAFEDLKSVIEPGAKIRLIKNKTEELLSFIKEGTPTNPTPIPGVSILDDIKKYLSTGGTISLFAGSLIVILSMSFDWSPEMSIALQALLSIVFESMAVAYNTSERTFKKVLENVLTYVLTTNILASCLIIIFGSKLNAEQSSAIQYASKTSLNLFLIWLKSVKK